MLFSKIKEAFSSKFNEIFNRNDSINEIIDEIEELLILSDVGVVTTSDICDNLKDKLIKDKDYSKEHVKEVLKEELLDKLTVDYNEINEEESDKKVILVVGVNGVGKTTSIAKIANMYKQNGKKVLLAAGDTFRAGAIEQLKIWADRIGVRCVMGIDGQDPTSVIFDASKEYVKESYDILICDSAGRLHNKKNLMDEIEKIKKCVDKNIPNIKTEVLMVIDATTGQNALSQAKAFFDKTSVDAIMLTKLDSSAKGGVVFGIINELNIPIKFIGVGEKLEDIKKFDKNEFVNAII